MYLQALETEESKPTSESNGKSVSAHGKWGTKDPSLARIAKVSCQTKAGARLCPDAPAWECVEGRSHLSISWVSTLVPSR